MIDTVDKQTRSRIMAAIRGKDTKPELVIRSILHRGNYRFRLHMANLPGKPDIVLKRHGAIIRVNGCFWHGHKCHLYRLPDSRRSYWREKIRNNRNRDRRNSRELAKLGWRVLTVWECAFNGKTQLDFDDFVDEMFGWLEGGEGGADITGANPAR